MAQAATRQSSAVRKRHAAHPHRPQSAQKPGTPASANDGTDGDERSGGRSNSGGGRSSSGRGGGASSGRGGNDGGKDKGAASNFGKLMKQLMPQRPGAGELSLPKPHLSIWTKLVGKIVKKIAKHELRRLTEGKNWNLESIAAGELSEVPAKLGELAPAAAGLLKPGLPIQESIDVAVPIRFAWSEWMQLRFLPEGVDRVVEIEREDGALRGQVEGVTAGEWIAEVLDERERESFAWKSTEGSDCAGLVTFHSLSERLTRIELTLDVLPHHAKDSALLLTHIAGRRARRDLQRFKAELELVSPDVYANDEPASSD